jgi:putative ABC transport system substrate-binding protein
MSRRASILLALCAALALALACAVRPAPAQPAAKVYRIGLLEAVSPTQNAANLEALRKGLADLGYVEGRNLVIVYRSADGHAERFPELAAELVAQQVDVIVTRGTPATNAARNAAGAVPVVMATMGDPRAIVQSYARPGGNVTGLTTFSTELSGKRVEILKELVPTLSRVALLHNMANPAVPAEWEETKAAARALGIDAALLDVREAQALPRAFAEAARQGAGAIVVGADGLLQANRQVIVDLAARYRLPAVYPDREFVVAGGLAAYAVSYPDLYYRFASYLDKILKGAKPGEIPVEQPTRFELVLNARAAKALAIAIPQPLLLRASEVLQ